MLVGIGSWAGLKHCFIQLSQDRVNVEGDIACFEEDYEAAPPRLSSPSCSLYLQRKVLREKLGQASMS